MTQKIGIIGKGIVGGSTGLAFEKLGHDVKYHDLKLGTKIEDLMDTEATFICVPTPLSSDNSCDTSIVENVIDQLGSIDYMGIVAIKSTIIPGTCEKIQKLHEKSRPSFAARVCYNAEFSRERCAFTDFYEHNKLLAIGTNNNEVYEKLVKIHEGISGKRVQLTPTQCEIVKYMSNCFGALRVVFANEIKDICDKLGQEYYPIKDSFITVNELPNLYFDVNDVSCRGYSSICWNKDVPALVKKAEELDLKLPILSNIEKSNSLHIRTPFPNTREKYD